MKILIIRHGIAAQQTTKSADEARKLTKEGRQKMKKAAHGLRTLVDQIDLIATSPLTRAAQTADIVGEVYHGTRIVQIAALSPGRPPAVLLEWLNAHPPTATVALIGHEPHLSTFLCWLMTGLQESFVKLKKGGVAMLEINGPATAGRAKLVWLMRPGQLRKLA
jgi:phosphohistidine phosphatase